MTRTILGSADADLQGPEDLGVPDGVGGAGGPILAVRWILALSIGYAVLYLPGSIVDSQVRLTYVLAVLGYNVVATFITRRSLSYGLATFISLVDIAIVSATIILLKAATTQFFLAYFAVLSLAAFTQGALAAGAYSILTACAYATAMTLQLGPEVLRDSSMILRLAFLLGSGVFHAAVADEALRQRRRAREVTDRMRHVATHAQSLARDKYRLRALSEIGRLGLVGSAASGSEVLFEISKRVQKGVTVDRCSLVVFGHDGGTSYVAASSDDSTVEVRPLEINEYPELQESLANGEITELRRGEPRELWERVTRFLPGVSRFNSFLVVPIKAGEQVFGAFYLRDGDPDREYDDEERDFCWASALMAASFIRGRGLLDQLRQQSRVDGLTGLLNFQAFTDTLHRTLAGAQSRDTYTLAVIDMDNLKEINDRHGHISGNRAIIELGRRLGEALPHSVAMCRYGGDEFVTLVPGDLDDAVAHLNTMLNDLSAMEWDAPFDVRASVGAAQWPLHGENPDGLLDAADQAMYLAKGAGGHRIRTADSASSESELFDAVVQVQTRRIVPDAQEQFNEQLSELQRRAILGLQAPVVKQSIAGLMEAVELNDPHSKSHARQVGELCRLLASELGLSEEQVRFVEIAGFLHDIGKIRIPAEVLTKVGTLDPQERALIERAPSEGAKILEMLPGLRRVAQIVLTYQERWDGSGYPRGLRGEQIPLASQVVGICDVYDALTSERAQRPAMEEFRARRLIEQDMGRLWSPRVARALLDLLARTNPAFEAGNDEAEDVRHIHAAGG